jgi:hypothetical protein
MSGFPTGSIPFLFTDIEESTSLWECSPDAMRAATTRHDAFVEATVDVGKWVRVAPVRAQQRLGPRWAETSGRFSAGPVGRLQRWGE